MRSTSSCPRRNVKGSIPAEEFEARRRKSEDVGAPIIRIGAPLHDSLLRKPRKSSTHGCDRTEFQEEKRLRCKGFLLFLRVADLNHDVEVDERPKKRELLSLKFPHFFECGEQFHASSFSRSGALILRRDAALRKVYCVPIWNIFTRAWSRQRIGEADHSHPNSSSAESTMLSGRRNAFVGKDSHRT